MQYSPVIRAALAGVLATQALAAPIISTPLFNLPNIPVTQIADSPAQQAMLLGDVPPGP